VRNAPPCSDFLPERERALVELGPSREALLLALALSLVLLVLVYVLWSGRIEFHAPPEQQREAEKHA